MLTNGLGDCASLIISVSMSSYLLANSNIQRKFDSACFPTVIFVTHVRELKTFPNSRQVNVGNILLIDASQVHFQRILSRCKWCCVIIVDLTSFFPSKEFLLVLESFKIAMKASSWKLTKIIKGSIISPLSASRGWNCVNLLVFCRRGKWRWMSSKYATRDLMSRPLIGHTPHARLLIGPCPGLVSPLSLVWMAQTRWHAGRDTARHKHVTTRHGARHDINMTCY